MTHAQAASKPSPLRATLGLRALSFLKIPMLFRCSPSVLELTDARCVVKIPHKRFTKNHLGSMYFGALSVGADCAGGLIAWNQIEQSGHKIALIFKDFKAEFLKRAEADVWFTCTQGIEIAQLVKKAAETGERVELPVHITATTPDVTGDEVVANFVLTLSLKKRK